MGSKEEFKKNLRRWFPESTRGYWFILIGVLAIPLDLEQVLIGFVITYGILTLFLGRNE